MPRHLARLNLQTFALFSGGGGACCLGRAVVEVRFGYFHGRGVNFLPSSLTPSTCVRMLGWGLQWSGSRAEEGLLFPGGLVSAGARKRSEWGGSSAKKGKDEWEEGESRRTKGRKAVLGATGLGFEPWSTLPLGQLPTLLVPSQMEAPN